MFLHIDIDCFFASAERSVNATLKGKPMCVGSRSNLEIFNKKRTNIRLINDNSGAFVTPVFYSNTQKTFKNYFVDRIDGREKIRGIVTTASYEARAKGVKTAMPIAHALQLCPELIVIPSNYPLYHKLSNQIHAFMRAHIPKVEQFSIDEFFCDVSGWIKEDEVYAFALMLQAKMQNHFDIPVSIGISKAKWIAKLATESAKPYGVYEVSDIEKYIHTIPIGAFPGIGTAFQKKLASHYIKTLGDIKIHKSLFYSWKKPGIQLYKRVLGIDQEGINIKSQRKSIGISRTFDAISDPLEIERRIMIMARHIIYMVMAIEVNPTSYYLKIHYEYGVKVKKTFTAQTIFSEQRFKEMLLNMYKEIFLVHKNAIKLTLNVSNFSSLHLKTLSLLEYHQGVDDRAIDKHIHLLRQKFGLDIIKTANEM